MSRTPTALDKARQIFDYYERWVLLPLMNSCEEKSAKWHVCYRIYLLREALSIWDDEKKMMFGERVAEKRRERIVVLFQEMFQHVEIVNEPNMWKFHIRHTEYDLIQISTVIRNAVESAAPPAQPAAHTAQPAAPRVHVGGGAARVAHADRAKNDDPTTSRKAHMHEEMHEQLAELGRLSDMMSVR